MFSKVLRVAQTVAFQRFCAMDIEDDLNHSDLSKLPKEVQTEIFESKKRHEFITYSEAIAYAVFVAALLDEAGGAECPRCSD